MEETFRALSNADTTTLLNMLKLHFDQRATVEVIASLCHQLVTL